MLACAWWLSAENASNTWRHKIQSLTSAFSQTSCSVWESAGQLESTSTDIPEPSQGRALRKNFRCLCGEGCLKLAHSSVLKQA